jgi:hypothetical protein
LALGAASAQAALPDEATLYQNPQCGCCDAYARHLEELGVEVTIIDDVELGDIKQQAGVPYGLGSCHTIEMGEYWIEGHVPMEAVQALFEEQPDIDGIGLAGMILPSNSGHLKNVIRYDEVNHGKIDNINEEKIIYPLLRWLPARSISAC